MDEKLICIATTSTRTEAEQVLSFLESHKIPALIQNGVMDIYTGDSISGEKIMVSSANSAKARELLQEFTPVGTRSSAPGKQTTSTQKAAGWILLGLIGAILIFAVAILL